MSIAPDTIATPNPPQLLLFAEPTLNLQRLKSYLRQNYRTSSQILFTSLFFSFIPLATCKTSKPTSFVYSNSNILLSKITARTPKGPSFKLFSLLYSRASTVSLKWWAWEDSNFRPHAYQACALTN